MIVLLSWNPYWIFLPLIVVLLVILISFNPFSASSIAIGDKDTEFFGTILYAWPIASSTTSIHLDLTRLQNSIDFVSCACNSEHIAQNHPQWVSSYPRVRAWVNPHHKLTLFPLNGPERGC